MTRNIVPRANNEGKIGTSVKRWLEGHFGNLYKSGQEVATVSQLESHATRNDNPHTVTKSQIGLGNVPNTDATNRANHTGTQAQSTITNLSSDLAARVVGPSSVTTERVALFDGTTGKLLKEAALTIADLLSRANHSGTQTRSTISDFAHNATHVSGGGDPIKLDDLAQPDDNTDLNASSTRHGLLPKLSGNATDRLTGAGTWVPAGSTEYTDAQAKDAVGSVSSSTNSIQAVYDSINRLFTWVLKRKTSLSSGTQGALAEDSSGVYVVLGTSATSAAAGNDSRFPTADQKAALVGSHGTPAGANPYLTQSDPRLPLAALQSAVLEEDYEMEDTDTLSDTGLEFTASANATYLVTLNLRLFENGGGLDAQMIGPSGTTFLGNWLACDGTDDHIYAAGNMGTRTALAENLGGTVRALPALNLVVRVGSTAGTVKLQAAQTANFAIASSVYEGSFLRAERIS